jgi:hypothetical protein
MVLLFDSIEAEDAHLVTPRSAISWTKTAQDVLQQWVRFGAASVSESPLHLDEVPC